MLKSFVDKKSTHTIIALFFGISISCKRIDSVPLVHNYDVEVLAVKTIGHGSQGLNFPYNLQFWSDSVVAFSDGQIQQIHFFNIYNGNTFSRTINFRTNQPIYINRFDFISQDTVLISFHEASLGTIHDSALLMYDLKREIVLGNFSFMGSNVMLSNNYETKDMRLSDVIFPNNFELFLLPDMSVLVPALHGCFACEPDYVHRESTSLYRVFHSSVKLPPDYIDVSMPCDGVEDDEMYFPRFQMLLNGCRTSKGKLLMGFGNNNQLWVYDPLNDEVDVLPDRWTEKLPATKKSPINQFDDGTYYWEDKRQHSYYQFYYDRFTDLYYRYFTFPIDENENYLSQNYGHGGVIIFNNQFQVTGIAKLPFGLSFPFLPTKSGVLIYDRFESEETDSIQLKLVRFQTEGEEFMPTASEGVSAIQNGSVNSYLQRLGADIRDSVPYIIIPLDNTCPSCLDEISLILKDLERSDNIKVNKIICSTSSLKIEQYLKASSLEFDESYFLDVGNSFAAIFPNLVNVNTLSMKSGFVKLKQYGPFDLFTIKRDLKLDKTYR